MKRFLWVLIVLLLPVLLFAQYPVKPMNAGFPVEVKQDQILVKFKSNVPDAVIKKINSKENAQVLTTSPFSGVKVVKIPASKSVAEMIAKYETKSEVVYAEENSVMHAFNYVPNDPLYTYQWHFKSTVPGGLKMGEAWESIQSQVGNPGGDNSVIIGILDTGVAYEDNGRKIAIAPDLVNTNFVQGYDFVNNDTHPNDDEGHGTHVCGTIAQSTNNAEGTAGIAFNCSIMPVKILDASGSGTADMLANGLYYAADNGADVINLSLGWPPGYDPGITVRNAVQYAYEHGVTICAATGNDGANEVSYPAAYDDYVIAVGAVRLDGEISYYSNQGSSIDITAPGGDVNVDQDGDGYVDGVLQQTFGRRATDFGYYFYQGTSMATPHVAGVAGLLVSKGVSGPDAVRAALESTATDMGASGWDSGYGHGILNAAAAVAGNVTPPENRAPVANAGGPYSVIVGNAITLDGSGSTDLDGDALTYAWDFGDGANGTGVSPVHTYNSLGTFTVTLIVNDGELDSAPATTTVDVITQPVETSMTVSSIDMSLATRTSGRNVFTTANADVVVLDDTNAPVVNAVVSAQWSGLYSATVSGTTNGSGVATFASESIKNASGTFTLTVTDVAASGFVFDAANSVLTNSVSTSSAKAQLSNFPNPANPGTMISYTLPQAEHVKIDVYNVLGQHVKSLVNENMTQGVYQTYWNGLGANDVQLVSGLYLVRMQVGQNFQTLKVLLAK